MCWLGCPAFTAYNNGIYAFSIYFGPLFLVWIIVFRLSLFALLVALTALHPPALTARFAGRPVRITEDLPNVPLAQPAQQDVSNGVDHVLSALQRMLA